MIKKLQSTSEDKRVHYIDVSHLTYAEAKRLTDEWNKKMREGMPPMVETDPGLFLITDSNHGTVRGLVEDQMANPQGVTAKTGGLACPECGVKFVGDKKHDTEIHSICVEERVKRNLGGHSAAVE